MSQRPVTIIILTWNGFEYTKRCLDTLRKYTAFDNYELFVVDNGSSDGTVEYLRKASDVRTIFNKTNLGFVRANNQAIESARPDSDILLLNNDTEIPEDQRQWLDKLQATAYSSADIGIVGCRLRQPSGMLLHAGAYMPVKTFWGQQIGSEEKDVNQYPFVRDVESVVFACVYIRRDVIDRIGVLSKDYFAYFEDTDYCLAAREAGFRTVCSGDVTIIHHENVSTKENKVSHANLFKQSQATFKKKWARKLEGRYEQKLVWRSTVSRPHGYGMTSKDFLLELDRQNVEVTYRYLYGRGTVFPVEEPENTKYYLVNLMKERPVPRGVLHVVYGQGDAFVSNKGPYKVGFTMLEVSGLPKEWVRQANLMDEVWVPTEFNLRTFRESGVTKPIHVMPLGIDTNHFNPHIVKYPVADDYKFLTVFEWGERKAPENLLKAFNDTFRADEPVILLCKANVTDPGTDVRTALESLNLSADGGRIEFIFNKYFPHYELASLYRSADCFVLASRGEGWGMPILEAMACGLPVIATYWSAPTAFLTEANSYPLQVKRLINAVAKCPYYAGFKWADPDTDHLRHLFRHVFEHQDEARKKGERAAADVMAKWTISHAAKRVRKRLAEIDEERGKPCGVTVPSPTPTHSRRRVAIDVSRAIGEQITGVGRYAQNLVEGLAQHAPDDFSFILLPGFGTFVHPEYGRAYHYAAPASDNMEVYRGPLPAYSGPETVVQGIDLLHSTAYMMPPIADGAVVMTIHDLSFITHPMLHTGETVALCTENIKMAIDADTTFIAVSQHTKDDMVDLLKVDAARIHVIPNSFDASLFHEYGRKDIARVRKKLRLPEQYFLFLASLEPRKNLETVLECYRKHDVPCPLVVAGAQGWLNSPMKKRLDELKGKVVTVGYVAQQDLGPLYTGAHAFVYPSLYEGFGLPVLEAMACGTPAVTTRVSSLPEVVGESGILLDDPKDTAALADALSSLTDDEEKHARLCSAALRQARVFSMDTVTAQVVALYRALLKEQT